MAIPLRLCPPKKPLPTTTLEKERRAEERINNCYGGPYHTIPYHTIIIRTQDGTKSLVFPHVLAPYLVLITMFPVKVFWISISYWRNRFRYDTDNTHRHTSKFWTCSRARLQQRELLLQRERGLNRNTTCI